MKAILPTVCLIVLAFAGCSQQPDTLATGGYDEAEMAAATARAIREVDEFIAELTAGDSENYGVKAPITDGENTEHFWLVDVTYEDGQFSGTIGNDPGIVSNVKLGQPWTLGKTDISDWMYIRDGKMYGNYTMRPLLDTMPQQKADEFRAMFANP
jgi:uncharacterized protein YegJ (DUF2314 family)